MNIFVCNIGSTSFKFRLLAMEAGREAECARGAVEKVGSADARFTFGRPGDAPGAQSRPVPDQAAAIDLCLERLAALDGPGARRRIDAVAFKAVHGGPLPGVVRVTDEVLAVMESFAPAAPAHNPAYVAAMRAFARRRPDLPLVACFETGLHATIPAARRIYAIPQEWSSACGIQRWGFHGASHRHVAEQVAARLGRDRLRVISCHLGGSSSLCALRGTESIACSFGMTPQSGLPQNNRVGDLDPYVLPILARHTGMSCEAVLDHLGSHGGLLGISGLSNEMPVLLEAAKGGAERARLAVAVYVEAIRHYLGAFVVALGGLDALVFTGGIGSRAPEIRRRVCAGLGFLGVRIDATRNVATRNVATRNAASSDRTRCGDEARRDGEISPDGAPVTVLVMETNEELIVARQAYDHLRASEPRDGDPDGSTPR